MGAMPHQCTGLQQAAGLVSTWPEFCNCKRGAVPQLGQHAGAKQTNASRRVSSVLEVTSISGRRHLESFAGHA